MTAVPGLPAHMACPLCDVTPVTSQWLRIWSHDTLHVVRVLDMPLFPAYYRVIWREHATEWSELGPSDRQRCMEVVTVIEQLLREQLSPDKINLASLGNVVPHLHWHVVARFGWDTHFPQSIWSAPVRDIDADGSTHLSHIQDLLPRLDHSLVKRLNQWNLEQIQ
ncbi:HIT family protein [Amphibiibacter pelophylacis]|uniref:HIT family protein n=1 Tax=Amphibiibacter pelophylacis TaxID=1799477 RepID=A0ACC6NZ67_9BURK